MQDPNQCGSFASSSVQRSPPTILVSIATSRRPINRRILVETDAHSLNLRSHTSAHSRSVTARFADTFRTHGYVSSFLKYITARLTLRSQSTSRHPLATATCAFVSFYSIRALCHAPWYFSQRIALPVAHSLRLQPRVCSSSLSRRMAHFLVP